jgi:hypothetical protein
MLWGSFMDIVSLYNSHFIFQVKWNYLVLVRKCRKSAQALLSLTNNRQRCAQLQGIINYNSIALPQLVRPLLRVHGSTVHHKSTLPLLLVDQTTEVYFIIAMFAQLLYLYYP